MKGQTQTPNVTGQLTGMAAVHYVAAELSQRCFTVAITSRNARGVDILAVNPRQTTISIQVKGNRAKGTHSFWLLGKHDMTPVAMFYVFVNLHPVGQRADFYIVTRDYVVKHIVQSGTCYQLNRRDAQGFKDAWHLMDK